MPAQAQGDQGVIVVLQPGRDDGDLQGILRVTVVREDLGIDTEIPVNMYLHMAEDVIVGRGNGLPPEDLLPLAPVQCQGFFLLQIRLTVPHQLLGVRVIRGQGQPSFCVFIGGRCGTVCHQAGIAHPGVPVGVALPLGADGLQQLNGVPNKIPVYFIVLTVSAVITQHRQIAVGPAQHDGQQIAALPLRDGFDGLDAPGKLVRLIPLLQLLQQFCFISLVHFRTAFPVSSCLF